MLEVKLRVCYVGLRRSSLDFGWFFVGLREKGRYGIVDFIVIWVIIIGVSVIR